MAWQRVGAIVTKRDWPQHGDAITLRIGLQSSLVTSCSCYKFVSEQRELEDAQLDSDTNIIMTLSFGIRARQRLE